MIQAVVTSIVDKKLVRVKREHRVDAAGCKYVNRVQIRLKNVQGESKQGKKCALCVLRAFVHVHVQCALCCDW